jgi:hypothetical protein
VSAPATNILTAWRRLVMARLDEHLQGGTFDVRGGARDGSSTKKLAVVFAPPVRAEAGNVNWARPILLVRAWLPKPRTPRETSPPDPEPLEQLMIDLCQTLEPIQVLEDIDLYFFVEEVVPDEEDWGVQATLRGWERNPATTP